MSNKPKPHPHAEAYLYINGKKLTYWIGNGGLPVGMGPGLTEDEAEEVNTFMNGMLRAMGFNTYTGEPAEPLRSENVKEDVEWLTADEFSYEMSHPDMGIPRYMLINALLYNKLRTDPTLRERLRRELNAKEEA